MITIPDAPWIRDAELNGMPEGDEVNCPICGRRCEDIYLDLNNDPVGCDCCIRIKDAFDWMWDNREV